MADDQPVITYQDNLQMEITSMHHLLLSKLQKEKMKQNKMWDFTVRGWRIPDTGGLEELFNSKDTAATSQRKVNSLEYEAPLLCVSTYRDCHLFLGKLF